MSFLVKFGKLSKALISIEDSSPKDFVSQTGSNPRFIQSLTVEKIQPIYKEEFFLTQNSLDAPRLSDSEKSPNDEHGFVFIKDGELLPCA